MFDENNNVILYIKALSTTYFKIHHSIYYHIKNFENIKYYQTKHFTKLNIATKLDPQNSNYRGIKHIDSPK